MRTGRWRVLGIAVGVMVVAPACSGRAEYTYLESDDGHMYAKIPAEWEVDRQGAVDYSMIEKDNLVQFAFTAGDSTQPWRAEFSADGRDGDVPSGLIEAQHVDARIRDTFRLRAFIDQVRSVYDDYERADFPGADVVGYRVTFTTDDGDEPTEFHEVWYMDERRSAIYRASVSCDADCMDRYADDIDEFIETFTVKP